jgi:hypothetical protein
MRWIWALLILAGFIFNVRGAGAEDNRRVLALYDSKAPIMKTADTCNIHAVMEMPLNRLGMVVDYYDVNALPLPDASWYRAIIVWFPDNTLENPQAYLQWLAKSLRGGTKAVIIDGFGGVADRHGLETNAALMREVHSLFGIKLDFSVGYTANPFLIKMKDVAPEHFGFEVKSLPPSALYQLWRPCQNNIQVWQTMSRSDAPGSEGVAVAIGPHGGFVLDHTCILRDFQTIATSTSANLGESRDASIPAYYFTWYMNPFDFLQAALDCKDLLRPDVTTAFGARAAYSHIDGDGIRNMTVDVPGPERSCGEVIFTEVLQKYPVPVSVAPVVGDIDPAALGSPVYVKLAKDMLSLPNVQPACHGCAHPLNWEQKTVALKIPGYVYSEEIEVARAAGYIDRELLSGGRRVEVYQWTGNCLAPESALKICAEAGLLGINGGDPNCCDALHPSIWNIPALTRPVGRLRQVYATDTNEEFYTDLWTRNFGAFRNVIQTFERSETPRRLLPVDVYYHFFSGTRLAGLRAVQEVYDWCLRQPLCWMHVAEYVRSVNGFMSARVGRTEDGGYWIEDFGQCLTARLDDCARNVDMFRSTGVIGFTHHGGSLYVSLAPGQRAEIYLCDTAPSRLCLLRSTSFLRNVAADERHWSAEARLYAPGALQLQGFKPRAPACVSINGRVQTITATDQGILEAPLGKGSGEWVEISIAL